MVKIRVRNQSREQVNADGSIDDMSIMTPAPLRIEQMDDGVIWIQHGEHHFQIRAQRTTTKIRLWRTAGAEAGE